MALFGSYAQPGVYTDVQISEGGMPLFGNARVPVLIGEGLEYFEKFNVERHRGSSAVADDQIVSENISDQIKPESVGNHTYKTYYFPVVTGDGSGTVANDVNKIQVTADGVPLTVVSLDGQTGVFMVQELVQEGQNLEVSYFFKKVDTLITEDLSHQIPQYAKMSIASDALVISVTVPGSVGNQVSITFTQATTGNGKADTQAVSVTGDDITVEIRKTDDTVRSLSAIKTLLEGVATASAGYLTCTLAAAHAADSAAAVAKANLTGGLGPNSNTVFQTVHVPIVDGTNGGVVTTSPKDVTALVNGEAVTVSSVDGKLGVITLAAPVAYGSTLSLTYHTNTYQDTSDVLPNVGVSEVLSVGLGPDRADYVEGIDFVLGSDADGNSSINWGASVSTTTGKTTSTVPFNGKVINTKLVDEKIYLRPVAGVCNGKNASFILEFIPVDGSGRGVWTNDPSKVKVYVGANAAAALEAGAVNVASVTAGTRTVVLYNPPQAGQKVFATYHRNTLADNTYTLAVVNGGQAGIPGQGTYKVTDSLNRKLSVAKFVSSTVTDATYKAALEAGTAWQDYSVDSLTGAVYPGDLKASFGGVAETVTLTLNHDGDNTTPGVQAAATIKGVTFTAQEPGTDGDSITIAIDATQGNGQPGGKVTVSGTTITIAAYNTTSSSVLTVSQVVALFATPVAVTVGSNTVHVQASGTGSTQVDTESGTLQGGVDPVSTPVVSSFVVSSSDAVNGSAGTGFFGQTYIDAKTGLKFTLALPTGYTLTPSQQIVLAVDPTAAFVVGSVWNVGIPGIEAKVATTQLMNAGDTAVITTFAKDGDEPSVGEYYYVSYRVPKTADDMALRLFNNPEDAYEIYGQPSPVNRLSLAIQLMAQNGAQTFGAIQVPKQPGLNTASKDSFISAIQSLTIPLPGSSRKADVIVPVTSDMQVIQFLSHQLITQANIRNKGEAIGFVGFAATTDAVTARKYARSIKNARVVAIANAVAGIVMTDANTGLGVEYAVSGEFMAAAMAGLSCNPSNDVATTLTMQNLVGFSRLLKKYDDATMNQMAQDGLTVLTENNGALNIRHYKSTDPSNQITSEPTCTTVSDYVRQMFRADLQQFINRKLVDSLVTDIKAVCNARLRNLVTNEIITSYKNLVVKQDESDPTTVLVTVSFKPMFSLLYISVTFTVTLAKA
jgi:hypothetical protein